MAPQNEIKVKVFLLKCNRLKGSKIKRGEGRKGKGRERGGEYFENPMSRGVVGVTVGMCNQIYKKLINILSDRIPKGYQLG